MTFVPHAEMATDIYSPQITKWLQQGKYSTLNIIYSMSEFTAVTYRSVEKSKEHALLTSPPRCILGTPLQHVSTLCDLSLLSLANYLLFFLARGMVNVLGFWREPCSFIYFLALMSLPSSPGRGCFSSEEIATQHIHKVRIYFPAKGKATNLLCCK